MNKDIIDIRKSMVRAIKQEANALKEKGIKIISLASGEPDFDTPEKIINEAISQLKKGNTHYAPGKGIPKLRDAIRQKLRKENSIFVDQEEIILTYGAKMAVYLSVRACVSHGDEVLLPTPSWVSYAEIVRAAGGIPIQIDLSDSDNYQISCDLLNRFVSEKTKLLIICTPNNPTGHILNKQELCEISKFANEHDVTVLSDEVYEKIVFDGYRMISPASLSELKDRTITVNGFSKTYAMTGWRLGYLAAPKKYVDVINKLHIHTHTGTSPFIQEAALKAFDCESEVEYMRRQYQERRDIFISGLNDIPNLQVIKPEGAFYAWVKFDYPNLSSMDFALWLLREAHVLGIPGKAYGDNYDNFIRFSFASSTDELKEALGRIKALLSKKQ